jgi:hypothetical protein
VCVCACMSVYMCVCICLYMHVYTHTRTLDLNTKTHVIKLCAEFQCMNEPYIHMCTCVDACSDVHALKTQRFESCMGVGCAAFAQMF